MAKKDKKTSTLVKKKKAERKKKDRDATIETVEDTVEPTSAGPTKKKGTGRRKDKDTTIETVEDMTVEAVSAGPTKKNPLRVVPSVSPLATTPSMAIPPPMMIAPVTPSVSMTPINSPAAPPVAQGAPVWVSVERKQRDKDATIEEGEGSEKRKRIEVVNNWARSVLKTGVDGLMKEFLAIPNGKDDDPIAAFKENPTKNRYVNIPCCDTTRVRIPNEPTYYIHANIVSTGNNPRRFVCAQAPLNGTVEDFWKMIVSTRIECIVMLCEVVEKKKVKSAQYFPKAIGEQMKIQKLCTVTKEAAHNLDPNLIQSTFRITLQDGTTSMIVRHLHWLGWPDHGVPEQIAMPFKVIQACRAAGFGKPILIHCSAGVGRTGTLALIYIIVESLSLPNFPGSASLLVRLREERYRAIQTEWQYLYVHRCILEYLFKKKYAVPEDELKKFVSDYEISLKNAPTPPA
uniref:Protein-tyrosine-phosphatase n=1 Tax=Caenorhabditis japonica TaxID=281687 RepID=A0A8R1HII6_CAEJA